MLKEQDYIEIKVRIGDLLNCFPTRRIRRKDMNLYNHKLKNVVDDIERRINASYVDNKDSKKVCLNDVCQYFNRNYRTNCSHGNWRCIRPKSKPIQK